MNKERIDYYIPKAYQALEDFKVVENGEVSKTFRGYISSFGAAIVMGSLRAAIAFNSSQNGALRERDSLMKILYALITDSKAEGVESVSLLKYVIANPDKEEEIKEEIYNAAIAVKLAMNMYVLVEVKK